MSDVADIPHVVADLTFTPVRGGGQRCLPAAGRRPAPVVGEQVLVADGGSGPFEATIRPLSAIPVL